MSEQTLNDRLTATQHAPAGAGLANTVRKATTEEVIGPERKHLDYLLHYMNKPNVSIPQLANLLIEQTHSTSWVVVFKALITVHHLMCYGNERFTQYLASSNCTFQLGCFLDKVGVQSYDMSTFIRKYAKYLNEKAVSYRIVAFDFCECKRGKEDGILSQMNTEQRLKTLPALQTQLDSLLEFDCSTNDLCNGVVNACFVLLFRDLIRLFALYNDGIIHLLDDYFDMNKTDARDALDIYKKFLIRMDRVIEFLKLAESVGIDEDEIPDLMKAPSSILEALEEHLATLEVREGSASAASAAARATNLKSAVSALSHTSHTCGSSGEGNSLTQEVNGIKVDETVKKAVEEEAEVMSQLKQSSTPQQQDQTFAAFTNEKLCNKLSKDFGAFYESKMDADCIIKVNGEQFLVHRLILSARSEVFASMFRHDTSENCNGVVDIPDVEAKHLDGILYYMYSGQIRGLSTDTAVGMCLLADKYALTEMKNSIIDFLVCNITMENVCDVAGVAHVLDTESTLKNSVIQFIKANTKKLVENDAWITFSKTQHSLAIEYLQCALMA